MKKTSYLIREFAKLTQVTVRTLHYYDQIGLLKPSFERPNGYRVYTDADLLKLQQIVTLKFMGFSLDEIRRLLDSKGYEAVKALKVQAAAVKDEIGRLREASRAIDQVLARLEKDGRIHRQKLIKIMEVIQMGEDVKKAWHEKFFTEEELKKFQELGKKYTPEDMAAYQNRWAATDRRGQSQPRARSGERQGPGPGQALDGPARRGLRRSTGPQGPDRQGLQRRRYPKGIQHDRPRGLGLHQEGPRGGQEVVPGAGIDPIPLSAR